LRRLNFAVLRQLTLAVLLSGTICGSKTVAQAGRQPFTLIEEIGLSHFGDPYGGQAEALQTSPNGKYFAVVTERGRVDTNRPEGSLRFYCAEDVKNFLRRHHDSPPEPVWKIVVSEYKDGPAITNWHWLLDSSGIGFLEPTAEGKRLMLADLRKRKVRALTTSKQTVEFFDIRDANHYVYTVVERAAREPLGRQSGTSQVVATGRNFWELFFPDDPRVADNPALHSRRFLWSVQGDKRYLVKRDGAPLLLDYLGGALMTLSPFGTSIITAVPIPDVPESWETLYRPSLTSSPYRIRAGQHELQLIGSAHEYAIIVLKTGSIHLLTDAPIGTDAGWAGVKRPRWSGDGQAALLTNTFLNSSTNRPSRPCIAVVNIVSGSRTCLERMKGRTEKGLEDGYHLISTATFLDGDKQRVLVTFINYADQSAGCTLYQQEDDGTWTTHDELTEGSDAGSRDFKVDVKQGINDPPVLVASNKETARVLWDPNPQLKSVALGEASVYTWRDNQGRTWKGGLYKPVHYTARQRYPLVIQTHGFTESEFRPSGFYPTAFAARALASAGIMVLQVGEKACPLLTPEEGPCAVSGYQSAANQLVSDGLVDPEKIGIVGFSRTCFYVMEALTSGSLQIKAASITDGVMEDYLQYLLDAGEELPEADSMIGSKPFGEGLEVWLKRSPGFNLDKVNAPLLVVGEGISSLLSMWQPYAGLYRLHKPVDLVMLNTDEHVLTNPAMRMASQGGTVDWFRFWLLDEEDPAPNKAGQYIRWRDFRTQHSNSLAIP
jgi:dipeptidyl aminopeptidase/acylaminoacyl peptidase